MTQDQTDRVPEPGEDGYVYERAITEEEKRQINAQGEKERAERWDWLLDHLPDGFDGDGATESLIADALAQLSSLTEELELLRRHKDTNEQVWNATVDGLREELTQVRAERYELLEATQRFYNGNGLPEA